MISTQIHFVSKHVHSLLENKFPTKARKAYATMPKSIMGSIKLPLAEFMLLHCTTVFLEKAVFERLLPL